MDRILRVPISFLGLSLPSHGYHSRNEHFDWGQASGGIRMFLRYFAEIARIPAFPPTANSKRLISPERIFMGYCIDDLAA